MPPKKKRSKSKSRVRPTQTQSQKVIVNIGGSSSKRKRRSGGGGMTPASHAQNLVPFFVQSAPTHQPLVDYDRIARMTGSLQERNEPNRTPPVQTQVPSVMAVAAAEERRAGKTAGGFEPPPSLSRSLSVPEMVASIEAKQVTAAVAQPAAMFEEGLIKKGMGIGRAVGEKNVEKKVSQAQELGAAEERLKVSRANQEDREKELMGRENLRTGLRRFNDTFSQRAEALNPMDEEGKDKLRAEFKQKGNTQFSGFSTLRDLTKDAQDKLRKKRVAKPAPKPSPKPKPLKKRVDSSSSDNDI
jgi:hypothetical protein